MSKHVLHCWLLTLWRYFRDVPTSCTLDVTYSPTSNQNHICKSPGANPLDQDTHSSFTTKMFIVKIRPFSEVSARESVRSAALHVGHLLLLLSMRSISVYHTSYVFAVIHVVQVRRF